MILCQLKINGEFVENQSFTTEEIAGRQKYVVVFASNQIPEGYEDD